MMTKQQMQMTTTEKEKIPQQTLPLFANSLLEKRIVIPVQLVNEELEINLVKYLANKMENRCIEEGYVLPSSIQLEQYSVGKINPHGIEFIVIIQCKICYPVEGMMIHCVITDITKAGIHAVYFTDDGFKPLTVYIFRDHQFNNQEFENAKKNTDIYVRIIGVRFELNDSCIHVIAEFP